MRSPAPAEGRAATAWVLCFIGLGACSGPTKQPWVEPAHAEAKSESRKQPAAAAEADDVGDDPAQAIRFVEEGRALYLQGAYDNAEIALKKAVQLDPFRADARIALGKVFLIRGAAARDEALLESARLMFEMARALDANAREAVLLLELFDSQAR